MTQAYDIIEQQYAGDSPEGARVPMQECALWQRWLDHHDIAAAGQLVRRYRGLVVEVATDHCCGHLPSDAAIAEAQIGLMRALCRFSPETNTSFRRYAVSCMRAALHEHEVSTTSLFNRAPVVSMASRCSH